MGGGLRNIRVQLWSHVLGGDRGLREKLTEGHRYYVYVGDTPLDALQDISEWLNIDQNENQVTHLCQIVKQIQTVANKEYKLAKEVKLMTIVQKVMNGVGVTLLLQVVSSLTRYVTEQGAGRYVDALCDWHSASVNRAN